MTQAQIVTSPAEPAVPRSAEAYQRLLAEIEAVPERDLIPITIDIAVAVTTVLGSLPEIRAMRDEIEATLPGFDLRKFDLLEDYALALTHAQAVQRAAFTPRPAIVAAAEELTTTRDHLLADAWSLANHGYINPERLKECKRAIGYRPVAYDVLTLATVLKEDWSAVEGKTPITLADLSRAEVKAEELLEAVGLKDQSPVMMSEAVRLRQKAFTLFMNVYDDIRRAIVYLRGKQDDADKIAPSLYAGRAPRRKAEEEPPEAPTPVPPVLTPETDTPPPVVPATSGGLPITQPYQ
jgi:hypothetical protein